MPWTVEEDQVRIGNRDCFFVEHATCALRRVDAELRERPIHLR